MFGEQVLESGEARAVLRVAGSEADTAGVCPVPRPCAWGRAAAEDSRLLCLGAVLSRLPLHVKQVGFAATGPSPLPPGSGFTRVWVLCRPGAAPEDFGAGLSPGKCLAFLPSGTILL